MLELIDARPEQTLQRVVLADVRGDPKGAALQLFDFIGSGGDQIGTT